jgi:release factor glutamine methyltransferase
MTLAEAVAAARARLAAAGIPGDEAALDARLLAQHVLGWDGARWLTEARLAASPVFLNAYEVAVARRLRREPAAYILGLREFWNLTFEVGPGVLVPRPETEVIVEAALEAFPDRAEEILALDVGTGCGCLAVALARERPCARVVATDLQDAALAIAARNAERHGVSDRIGLVKADLWAGDRRPFDLIMSNPPYLPEADRSSLQPEVREYEPEEALFAGPDGLSIVRRLVTESPSHLRRGGWLLFEIGAGQADPVRALISQTAGLKMVAIRRDLQGIPRTVAARRE